MKTETTENHNTLYIPSREEFHRHYGGAVYESDFNTEYNHSSESGSQIASRIESDFRREEKLYRDTISRKASEIKGQEHE